MGPGIHPFLMDLEEQGQGPEEIDYTNEED
jgi:hypothetical protein